MAKEDRQKLVGFLNELQAHLEKAVKVKPKISRELRHHFQDDWDTIIEAFDSLRAELNNNSSTDTDEKLKSRGLVGPQLDLKEAGWERAQKKNWLSSLFPGRWLAMLLRWANVILGSLASAFPPAEVIKEFKECLENDLADQQVIRPWRLGTLPIGSRGIVSAVMVLLAGFSAWGANTAAPESLFHWLIIGGWAIGPPLYFLIEYSQAGDMEEKQFEYLKHGQQLAGALWAGVLAVLFAIYQHRNWLQ